MPAGVLIRDVGTCRFVAANDSRLSTVGKVSAKVRIGPFSKEATFYILPTLSCSMLLGMDFIDKHGLVLNYRQHCLDFPEAAHVKIPFVGSPGCLSGKACYVRQTVELPPRSTTLVDVIFPMEKLPKASSKGVGKESKGPGIFW